ncbi:MAG: helix-turn-helix domain-containing protein [Archangium sp.]|nr:helix-turn-helix domain-containing protein [Archangium sp.]
MSHVRATILSSARKLARGPSPFTMDQLALAAGCSRATLYRRFPSRTSVIDALRAAGVSETEVPQATRTRVLAAAERLLGQRGLQAFTFEAVAAESGVSVPTLRRHFRGRAGLLQALAESKPVRHDGRALALDATTPFDVALEAFAVKALKALRASAALFRLGLAASAEQRALASSPGRSPGTVAALTTFFRRQQRLGRLAKDQEPGFLAAAFAAQLVSFGALMPTLAPAKLRSDAAMAKAMTRLFLQGARR